MRRHEKREKGEVKGERRAVGEAKEEGRAVGETKKKEGRSSSIQRRRVQRS